MDAKYILGVSQIDAEHERLFTLNDMLKDANLYKTPTDVIVILSELYDYVFTHFRNEENLILGWVGYTKHYTQHRKLEFELDNIFSLIYTKHKTNFCIKDQVVELQSFVSDWLNYHILKEDAEYTDYVKKSLSLS